MKLVFLHGIGDGDVKSAWCRALCDGLSEMAYPRVDFDDVIAPHYAPLLREDTSPPCSLPEPGVRRLTAAQAAHEPWEYECRQAAMERLLEVPGGSVTTVGFPESLAECARSVPVFEVAQARNCLSNEGRRGSVLQTILKELPQAGEVVIVAHGLGSLVAINLLDYLPQELVVHRLVTIGSPIGHLVMHGKKNPLLKAFPLTRVKTWANFWSLSDPVPYGRGIAHLFAHALDVRVELGMCEHAGEPYLRSPLVAKAIGDALFGSLRREVATINAAVDVPLDDQEKIILAALAYGHFLGDEITDVGKQKRFRAALHEVQQSLISDLAEQCASDQRTMPARLRELADGRRPELGELFDLGKCITVLLEIVSKNIIHPYEIDVSVDARQHALARLASALNFPERVGTTIFAALNDARREVKVKAELKLKPLIGLAAVGGGLLLAGPIGLMMVAPAGLAGGAAVVSALAAFGPGGMIGGLVAAGGLMAAGGGVTGAAVKMLASAPEALIQDTLARLLATAIARHKLREPRDDRIWFVLCEFESQIAREQHRVEPLSDPDAPSCRAHRRKAQAVRQALECMIKIGLGPPHL